MAILGWYDDPNFRLVFLGNKKTISETQSVVDFH